MENPNPTGNPPTQPDPTDPDNTPVPGDGEEVKTSDKHQAA